MSTCGWGTINAVWQWVQLFLFTQPVRFVLLKCYGHSQQALFCFLYEVISCNPKMLCLFLLGDVFFPTP